MTNLHKKDYKTPVHCPGCNWIGTLKQTNIFSETIEPLCWIRICPVCDEPVEEQTTQGEK